MLPVYIKFLFTLLWLAGKGSSLPFSMIFSGIKLIVISISTLTCTYAQGPTCKVSSLLFLSIISSVCPGCSNARQTVCQFYLKSLISLGADLLGQPLTSYQVFSGFTYWCILRILIFHYFKLNGGWLARAAVSRFYLLFHLFAQVVLMHVRQLVNFILRHWHLEGLSSLGSHSPFTRIFWFYVVVVF